jgi:YVTN family beta-propeller protein
VPLHTIRIGAEPRALAFSPDAAFAYVVSNDDAVSVVDLSGTGIRTIPVGSDPRAIALNPDGAEADMLNFNDGTVSVIDAATYTVAETINVGGAPSSVAVSPDGGRAYVADYDGTVSVISSNSTTPSGVEVQAAE